MHCWRDGYKTNTDLQHVIKGRPLHKRDMSNIPMCYLGNVNTASDEFQGR